MTVPTTEQSIINGKIYELHKRIEKLEKIVENLTKRLEQHKESSSHNTFVGGTLK